MEDREAVDQAIKQAESLADPLETRSCWHLDLFMLFVPKWFWRKGGLKNTVFINSTSE